MNKVTRKKKICSYLRQTLVVPTSKIFEASVNSDSKALLVLKQFLTPVACIAFVVIHD